MAVIVIVLSSAVGLVSGVAYFLLWGATFWQGVGAYFLVTTLLSAINIAAMILAKGSDSGRVKPLNTLDDWAEWHEQEDWRDAELESLQPDHSFSLDVRPAVYKT